MSAITLYLARNAQNSTFIGDSALLSMYVDDSVCSGSNFLPVLFSKSLP